MYTFLLIILIIDALVLGAAILMQSGKGGGLAASFGGASSSSDSLIGSRQAGNLLTKASWWCGGIFIFLAFVLQIASTRTRTRTPASVLDKPFSQQPATPNAGTSKAPLPLEPATPTETGGKGTPTPPPKQ